MTENVRLLRPARRKTVLRAGSAIAGLLGLVLATGCGAALAANGSGNAGAIPAVTLKAQIAHDEAVIAKRYNGCVALHLSPPHCPFKVATTPNGTGGTIIAIDLTQQTGDSCYFGRVFFFSKETYLISTRWLRPFSVGGVENLRADGTRKIAVVYGVSSSANVSCAQNGNAGTDVYVYGWNGTHMYKRWGTPPALPKIIVGT